MLVSERWQPRPDINRGDYAIIPSVITPGYGRVVHVLCREECGSAYVYEPITVLPHAIPLKEAHDFLDRLKGV